MGKVGKTSYYKKGDSTFAIIGSNHFVWRESSMSWARTQSGKAPTHNRFGLGIAGRGGFRAASKKGKEGSAASYDLTRKIKKPARKVQAAAITAIKQKKRTYARAMRAATELEFPGHGTGSATTYASYFPAAPVIAGGYNWCHLIGHGGGGGDGAQNIVAASTHNNSEQLAIERVCYQFRNSGVGLRVDAELAAGSHHLARRLTYVVTVHDMPVYTRVMDAWRTTKPPFAEATAVDIAATAAITATLS